MYKLAMLNVGHSEKIIKRISVNPGPADVEPGQIPVYMEQRLYREFITRRITSKFAQ